MKSLLAAVPVLSDKSGTANTRYAADSTTSHGLHGTGGTRTKKRYEESVGGNAASIKENFKCLITLLIWQANPFV